MNDMGRNDQVGAISLASAQVHVGTLCNLKCKHCYSSSSPQGSSWLNIKHIEKFIDFIEKEHFQYVSYSGGEPTLYEHLDWALQYSLDKGLQVGLVTNGITLHHKRTAQVLSVIDSIAISIDGPEVIHDNLRNQKGALNKAIDGIKFAQDKGVNVKIIHTLTKASLEHIEWLVDLCTKLNICGLQIHPLEAVGHAKILMREQAADRETCSLAYIAMQIIDPTFSWQVDAFNREVVKSNLKMLGIIDDIENIPLLSKMVNPIVLNERGDILPYQYGVNESYKIASLKRPNLDFQLNDFRNNTFPKIQSILTKMVSSALDEDKLPYFNWYAMVTNRLQ